MSKKRVKKIVEVDEVVDVVVDTGKALEVYGGYKKNKAEREAEELEALKAPKWPGVGPRGPGMCRRRPGTPMGESSYRMLKKWQDPEYRKSVSERMKEKWKDPEYREMLAKSKNEHGSVGDRRLKLAVQYRKESDRLKQQAQMLLDHAATLIYHAALMEKTEYDKSGAVLIGRVTKKVGIEYGL